jgi:hypothetical protein
MKVGAAIRWPGVLVVDPLTIAARVENLLSAHGPFGNVQGRKLVAFFAFDRIGIFLGATVSRYVFVFDTPTIRSDICIGFNQRPRLLQYGADAALDADTQIAA